MFYFSMASRDGSEEIERSEQGGSPVPSVSNFRMRLLPEPSISRT